MDLQQLKQDLPTTPAFVFDADAIATALNRISALCAVSGGKFLYSIKSLPLSAVLQLAKPYVHGFSVSSLFEAQLADALLAGPGSIHLTTPGIRPQEITQLTELCSHISCNSLPQLQQLLSNNPAETSVGLRINPQYSVTGDARYDPCRPYTKLGVSMTALADTDKRLLSQIKGLHFHTVYSAETYAPLRHNVERLRSLIRTHQLQLNWLNFGGGYLYDQIGDKNQFTQLVQTLKQEFNLDIYIEPGNAVVGKAGYLVASVLDVFQSDGKTVAILDTSINHHPEVFEYQKAPILQEHDHNGAYPVLLAGSTCLAGDLFGEYLLPAPVRIGDRLTFAQVGAYTLVKANRFNGYNLPDIYWHLSGQTTCVKRYSYEDYRRQWVIDDE